MSHTAADAFMGIFGYRRGQMEDANLANGTDGYDNVFVRDMEETKNHRTECECDSCYNDWLEFQKYPFGQGAARRCIAENEKLKATNAELVKALERVVIHHTVSELTDLGCQEIKELIKESKGKL